MRTSLMLPYFDVSNMVNHPNKMLKGIKHFKIEFANGDYVSVLGGHSNVMSIQASGTNEFELGFTKGKSTEVEGYVETNRVNEVIAEFIKHQGFPTKINGKDISEI